MLSIFISAVCGHILYLALHLESSSFPRPLSPAKEAAAFRAFHNGDKAAKDILIRHNLRLVAHIAKKYYASSEDQDDLVSIGTIGLIKAVGSYRNDSKVKFSTYASRCIENEIKMHLRKIRREPSVLSMQESLETGRDGSSLTVMDVLPDDSHMEDDVDQKEDLQELKIHLNKLDSRERQILVLRYGLGGHPPLTQQETAAILGISRSYVSRLEKKALGQLQKHFIPPCS